jgi:hypothetical protein
MKVRLYAPDAGGDRYLGEIDIPPRERMQDVLVIGDRFFVRKAYLSAYYFREVAGEVLPADVKVPA